MSQAVKGEANFLNILRGSTKATWHSVTCRLSQSSKILFDHSQSDKTLSDPHKTLTIQMFCDCDMFCCGPFLRFLEKISRKIFFLKAHYARFVP